MSKRKWNCMNNSTQRVDMSLPIQVQSRLYHFKIHILALVAAHVYSVPLVSRLFGLSRTTFDKYRHQAEQGRLAPWIALPVSTAPPNLHSFSHDRSRKVSPMYL